MFSAQLSEEGFELICLDGSRKPISDYLSCNWGKVLSDTVVVSSAASADDRIKYQKFLQSFGERYGKQNTSYSDTSRNSNAFGNSNVQPEYDQFGNRVNRRFRRQNFDGVTYDNQDPYNPYSNQNQTRNNNPYGNNNNNLNPYTNTNNNYNPYSNDPYRTTESSNDPFAKDPYSINRDQYGVNIDPYSTDVKYNKANDPLFGNNNTYDFNNRGGVYQNNGTNVTYYEEFHLFQSIPRYGWHGNLMFQVIFLFTLFPNSGIHSSPIVKYMYNFISMKTFDERVKNFTLT